MKKLLYILALCLFAFNSHSDAQVFGRQILLKGAVTDSYDGKPVAVEIRIEDEKGKYFKIQSNSLTGNYEQILEADKNYKIRLNAKNILPTYFDVKTDTTSNYGEQEQNFFVTKLEKGRAVQCFDLFPTGESNLNSEVQNIFDEMNLNMRFNRSVSFYFEVTSDDSWEQFTKITTKKVKKNTVTEKTLDENAYNDLQQKRFETLQSKLGDLTKFTDRIEVRKASKENEKGADKHPKDCDVILRVKDFQDNMK
ncbi:MAG: hypothetical protein A2X64_08220 [Ignavibacteria bacterium GWF2_33_9]|nr:MAG: hypothetical protein A2X64_08220 [Ignavibacteria bacterium GWF2_33_9]